jgi:hypothetical protein
MPTLRSTLNDLAAKVALIPRQTRLQRLGMGALTVSQSERGDRQFGQTA